MARIGRSREEGRTIRSSTASWRVRAASVAGDERRSRLQDHRSKPQVVRERSAAPEDAMG